MGKPRVIIADEDFNYIVPIQIHLVEELFDQIDLEIITDKNYFAELFKSPQEADLLIISDVLFSEELDKHAIKHGFILSESPVTEEQYASDRFVSIYKYTNVKEIFSVIHGEAGIAVPTVSSSDGTKVVLVTAAAGGVGKTTVAFGIASSLSNHFKKVLYINVDYLQTFQSLMSNGTPIMDSKVYAEFSRSTTNSQGGFFRSLKHLIRRENFFYIPPFKGALLSIGLEHSIWVTLVREAKESGEFDYIVIDADISLNQDKIDLIDMADRIVLVTTQFKAAVYALNQLLENIELPNDEKITFICNQFDPRLENALLDQSFAQNIFVDGYVEKMDNYWEERQSKFSEDLEIQKIAMSLI